LPPRAPPQYVRAPLPRDRANEVFDAPPDLDLFGDELRGMLAPPEGARGGRARRGPPRRPGGALAAA
jgi:hypothetical protein